MAAFTTIASLTATAATTGMSFAQAAKQSKLQKQAEADAAKAMAEAKKKLDVNFYDQLAIMKEPYELEREALLSAGAQAIEAGVESERGAAATAGRVQMAQQQGQRQIASAMGQEMLGLEKLSAQEESRLRDLDVNMNLAEVEGANLAAREAARLGAAATTQGLQGVISMGQQISSMAPLYSKTPSAREFNKMQSLATDKFGLSPADFQKNIAALGNVNGVDFGQVSKMNELQFADFMGKVDPNVLKTVSNMIPSRLQSFRPESYSLKPTPAFDMYYNPFAITGIGGN